MLSVGFHARKLGLFICHCQHIKTTPVAHASCFYHVTGILIQIYIQIMKYFLKGHVIFKTPVFLV